MTIPPSFRGVFRLLVAYTALATVLVLFLSWALYREGTEVALLRKRLTEGSNPAVGAILPPFRAMSLSGEPLSVAFGKENPYTLLCFFTSDCEFCHLAAPVWERWARNLTVHVFGVALDGLAAVSRRDDLRLSFPVVELSDQTARATYRVSAVPLTLLLDEDGAVLLSHTGVPDEKVLARVQSLLGAAPAQSGRNIGQNAGKKTKSPPSRLF